jgi:hypothetical protein
VAFTAVDPGGPVELLLLSQCDIDVAPASLEKQPHPELIEAQAGAVAEAFARFVRGTRSRLDVASTTSASISAPCARRSSTQSMPPRIRA